MAKNGKPRRNDESAFAGGATPLVNDAVARLRNLVLSVPAYSKLGSLKELSTQLGVGIVTFQQASRILEHDGFLTIRRGSGGGYYGCRPDKSSLERIFTNFLWAAENDGYEAFRIKLLLELEVAQDAAGSSDPALFRELAILHDHADTCDSSADRIRFEGDLQDLLFHFLRMPLTETFMRVSMRYYSQCPIRAIFIEYEGSEAWKRWRKDFISGILSREPDLARFQAERHRTALLQRVRDR